ncbi:hypothetical protein vseg_005286 [Gypsophila vaccaria]
MAYLTSKTTLVFALFLMLVIVPMISGTEEPLPRMWPEKFHALLVMNDTETNKLIVNNLWYDWQNGLNVQLMQYQQWKLVHAVSWNNGTSFYFTSRAGRVIECITHDFGVGIIRPDFLQDATYLGQRHIDGYLCNVWEKAEFIWYYEDVVSKRPVHWLFYTGLDVHVMTFEEVDEMLEESEWQAPSYCFDKSVRGLNDPVLMAVGLAHNFLSPSPAIDLV